MTQPSTPPARPLPHPGPPPSPAATLAAHQRRWDAAVEEQRAGDQVREMARYGRATGEEARRYAQARLEWDAAREIERPATRRELDRIVTDTSGGGR